MVVFADRPLRTTSGRERVIRHTVHTSTAEFSLWLVAPAWMASRAAGDALADAVAELRAMDTVFSPLRPASLVSRVRRGEISPETYPPLAELVNRCAAMRAATDGWFDAWAVPGGFDPSGLLKGWTVERAAARLRAAGVSSYAITAGSDVAVRGHAPSGRPWRIGIRDPRRGNRLATVLDMTEGAVATCGATDRAGHVVDPHTGDAAGQLSIATVTGPDLAVADAYATALYAAGPAALRWFPTTDGYRAI